jgi:hypothetical protein
MGTKTSKWSIYYEANRIICLGITHDLHFEKRHVIMFPASKFRIMKPQWNIPTWLHSCETISHKRQIYASLIETVSKVFVSPCHNTGG